MQTVKLGEVLSDSFPVTTKKGEPVKGLLDRDFQKVLFGPDGAELSREVPITISELGNGMYRLNFRPSKAGHWVVTVSHPEHCPWGLSETYQVGEPSEAALEEEGEMEDMVANNKPTPYVILRHWPDRPTPDLIEHWDIKLKNEQGHLYEWSSGDDLFESADGVLGEAIDCCKGKKALEVEGQIDLKPGSKWNPTKVPAHLELVQSGQVHFVEEQPGLVIAYLDQLPFRAVQEGDSDEWDITLGVWAAMSKRRYAELITVPVGEYEPKELTDQVLGDDFRIGMAWYATLRAGKKIEKTEEQIRGYMKKIVKEVVERGTVTFNPATMRETSRQLLADTLWDLYGKGGKGVYLVPPHAQMIAEGKKKLKLAQRAWNLEGFYGLLDGKSVLGMARFGEMEKIDEEAFGKRKDEHKISKDELAAWGWDKWPLYGWKVREFVPFEKAKPFKLPKGAQKFVDLAMVKFQKFPEEVADKGIRELKDIVPENLEKLTKTELVLLDAWLHAAYEYGYRQRDMELEPMVNAEIFIVEEKERRGMERRVETPLDYAVERLRGTKMSEAELHEIKSGRLVYLKDVMPYFREFYTSKPHAYIVGSLAINGRGHDIDVLVKGRPEDNRIFEFRILHMFPPKLRDRIRFIYDPDGPFTSNVPLYAMKAERLEEGVATMAAELQRAAEPEIKKQGEEAKEKDKITFGEFFQPMKPIRGAFGEERQTIENFLKLLDAEDFPRYQSKKADGMSTEWHVTPDEAFAISEDGELYPEGSLPTVEAAFRRWAKDNQIKDAVVMAELESWRGKIHEPREAVAGIVHSAEPDDETVIANVFDVLYLNGKDLHNEPESERIRIGQGDLSWPQSTNKKPDVSKKLNYLPQTVARNSKELREQAERISFEPASEGIITRKHDATYRLTGESKAREWLKYHKTVSAVVEVVKREATKAKGAPYKYVYGLRYDPKKYDVFRDKGKGAEEDNPIWDRLIVLGRSFNWDKKLDKGDVFEIEAETVNFTDRADGTIEASFWVPRPMRLAKGPAEDLDVVVGRAAKQGILQRKTVTEEGETVYLQRLVKQPPMPADARKEISKCKGLSRQELAKIDPKKLPRWFWVLESHYRGKAQHDDFRVKQNGNLEGWTITGQVAGAIPDVNTLADARKLDAKFDDPKTFKFRPGMDPAKVKVFATRKAKQPLVWLTLVNRVVPEGTVGATKEEVGVFLGKDWGCLWPGVKKPWFEEYFVYGKRFQGRIVFRLVELEKKGRGLEPGLNFLTWVAKDVHPTLMTRRNRTKKEDVPPDGISWLPPNWEAAVPVEMRWWEKKQSKNRKLELMDKAYDYFIDEGILSGRKIAELAKEKFALTVHRWKGPEVVRGMWNTRHLLQMDGETWEFQEDPLREDIVVASRTEMEVDPPEGSWLTFDGEIPGGYMKPVTPEGPYPKKLPVLVDILDDGVVDVIEDTEQFVHLDFDGKKLKGRYVFRAEEPGGNIWRFGKSSDVGEPKEKL